MKISLFSLIFSKRSIQESIKLAKEIGYDGVELWGGEPHFPPGTTMEQAKEIRSMLDYYELEVPNIGSYVGNFSTISDSECEKTFEDLERYLDLMDIIKCDMIRVSCGGPNAFLAKSFHYDKALYWIGKCADLAGRYNKKIVMEIHNGSLIETIETADGFIKRLKKDNAGFIHDAGNMYITDTDYGLKSVETLNDKIYHVHVKDELRVDDDTLPGAFRNRTVYGDEVFQQKLLGEGAVDHYPLFKGLIKMGYKGFLSSECHAPVDDIEKARHELEEIRKQIQVARESI